MYECHSMVSAVTRHSVPYQWVGGGADEAVMA